MIKEMAMAARPKTLPAAVVPVWAGCVLAWRVEGEWTPWLAVVTLIGALCIQVATNFFNDAIDSSKGADTERRTGPQRVTASGLLAPRTVMALGLGFVLIAGICGLVLGAMSGWSLLLIGVPSLFLAYGYTGGPFPLAYRGWGEVFVVLFFGLAAVSGTFFVQTGTWSGEAVLLGAQVGLLSAVLISVNNLRDRVEDAGTGKRTVAVRFGPKVGRVLIWLEIKAAALLGLVWLPLGWPWFVLATLPLWTLGLRLEWDALTMPEDGKMNRLLAAGALQLIAFAGMFHVMAVVLR